MGDDHELDAVPGSELAEDPGDVGLGGQRAELQPVGDLLVGQPRGDELKDLQLARSQLVAPVRKGGGAGRPVNASIGRRVTLGASSASPAAIPILMFAFLFGLSMDYEVFVLARMREEYDRIGSTEAAVVGALSRTGRLVTSASLILAISFLSLSADPDLPVRVIATGLAFGILFDAFVVRTLLVPALVAMTGRWNWWMPDSVARTLRISEPQLVRTG